MLDATFSDPVGILPRLTIGMRFTVWDRGSLGEGVVVEIRDDATAGGHDIAMGTRTEAA